VKLVVVIPGRDEPDDGVHWPAVVGRALGLDRDRIARWVRR